MGTFLQHLHCQATTASSKTARIQEDHIQVLKRDDGSIKNIYLIDKQYIHNNYPQVINQYEVEGARSKRYDVTVLVNGLPMVHVELKRRGVISGRLSTRLTATSATASGRVPACSNTCSCSSSVTAR